MNTVRLLVRDGDGNPVNLDERDFLVLSFRFESGETGTYFVPVPKDSTFGAASVEPEVGPSHAAAVAGSTTRAAGAGPEIVGGRLEVDPLPRAAKASEPRPSAVVVLLELEDAVEL